jgi:bacillolysin
LLGLAGDNAKTLTQVTLYVLPLDNGDQVLAFSAIVSGSNGIFRCFVDASTGAELLRISALQTQSVVGTGTGVLGDRKKLSVLHEGGGYFADDQLRPPVLRTFDMRSNTSHAINVINGAPLFASDRASDSDNNWDDPVAVDAHAHIGWTYDYFFMRFGRRGLDNRDRAITALINGVSQQGALTLPASLSDLAINAFWCGVCGPFGGVMYFGNGIPPNYVLTSTGQNIGYLAGSLDVIAHELTHGVTESSSGLISRNESGALNEAFSDIMGTSVEFFYQTPGPGLRQADYLMAEDTVRGPVNGFRSLENPQAYVQGGVVSPDHYSRRYVGAADDGGVHINAGIPGNAFYLAIEGGTNRTSQVTVQGVGPNNREQIEKVYYRAFVFYMPASGTFSTARAATARAAQDLYGAGSAVERAVTEAWSAVGVF